MVEPIRSLFHCLVVVQLLCSSASGDSDVKCSIRAGRQLLVGFKRPKGVLGKDVGDIKLVTEEISTLQGKSYHTCYFKEKIDSFYCATWNIYIMAPIKKVYNLKAINVKTKREIWKFNGQYKPWMNLFHCYSKHNIEIMKIEETSNAKWMLSWVVPYWTQHFFPKYEVFLEEKLTAILTTSQCTKKRSCDYPIPNSYRGKEITICIKSLFNLNDGHNVYNRKHQTTICTVAKLTSNYRLKVFNVGTGEEVFDYGQWHYPQDDEKGLNATGIAEVKKTKQKLDSVWSTFKGAKDTGGDGQ